MGQKHIYKARLDFYYKLLVIYMSFLILYSLIRGSIEEGELTLVLQDPIIYISGLFTLYALAALIVNYLKGKELEFLSDRIVLRNRLGQREILFDDIISISFSRERRKDFYHKSNISRVKLKLRNRKRYLRIRLREFYDDKNLINEFKALSKAKKTD